MQPVAWITHPACRAHDMGPHHPESPSRLDAIEARLRDTGVFDFLNQVEAPEATREQLLRAHGASHIDRLFQADAGSLPRMIDSDTLQVRGTLAAALRAAGAAVRGVEIAMRGEAQLAFCAVRPPGHHAERDRAMGFCFFNNVAVAAGHAMAMGLSRIAVLDFDLHYGNGTADIFKDDPRVVMYSTYQHPLYPNWAGVADAANLVDVPMRAMAGSEGFRAAVTQHWLPKLEQQQPEMILVSAGFDAHAHDPLGDLRLSDDDYRWIGEVVRDLSAECCGSRVVATLEGGYDLPALARSVEAFLQPYLGDL